MTDANKTNISRSIPPHLIEPKYQRFSYKWDTRIKKLHMTSSNTMKSDVSMPSSFNSFRLNEAPVSHKGERCSHVKQVTKTSALSPGSRAYGNNLAEDISKKKRTCIYSMMRREHDNGELYLMASKKNLTSALHKKLLWESEGRSVHVCMSDFVHAVNSRQQQDVARYGWEIK